jgi:hypothetical protein
MMGNFWTTQGGVITIGIVGCVKGASKMIVASTRSPRSPSCRPPPFVKCFTAYLRSCRDIRIGYQESEQLQVRLEVTP